MSSRRRNTAPSGPWLDNFRRCHRAFGGRWEEELMPLLYEEAHRAFRRGISASSIAWITARKWPLP